MARGSRTVEAQLAQFIKDRMLGPRGKRRSVQLDLEYEDDRITVWSVETVMGSSWAIGATGAQCGLPTLYWKARLGDLEAAKAQGWAEHGHPDL
jgi:hypothetical protein